MQSFNPTSRDGRFFSVESSDTLSKEKWFWSFYFDHAENAAPIYQVGSAEQDLDSEPSTSFEFVRMTAASGVGSHMSLGLSLGYLTSLKIDPHFFLGSRRKTGLTDVQLFFKSRLIKIGRFGSAVSLGLDYLIDRKNPISGIGSGTNWHMMLINDLELTRYTHLSTNFGLRGRSRGEKDTLSGVSPMANQIIYSMGLQYAAFFGSRLIMELFGNLSTEEQFLPVKRDAMDAEVLLGLKTTLNGGVQLNYGFGRELTNGLATPSRRVFLGLSFYGSDVYRSRVGDLWDSISRSAPDFEKRRWPIIRFNHGRLNMPGNAMDKVYQELEYTKRELARVERIIVVGHTDQSGSESFNKAIGLKRARVISELIQAELGIDASRIEVSSMGESRPIGDESTVWGRAKNRRVEVTVIFSVEK